MNKKKTVLLLTMLLLVAAPALFAQSADNKIMGIENSMVFGYNLNTNDLGSGQEYSLHLTVAQNMQAGFVYLKGDGVAVWDGVFLRLAYGVLPNLGLNLSMGKYKADVGAGLGMYYNIFNNQVNDIDLILKVKVDYLTNKALGMAGGLVAAGLSAKIGL